MRGLDVVIHTSQKDREERKGKGGGTTLCRQVINSRAFHPVSGERTMSYQFRCIKWATETRGKKMPLKFLESARKRIFFQESKEVTGDRCIFI